MDADTDEPVTPSAEEIQEITQHHAARLIELISRIEQVRRMLRQPCSDKARMYRERDLIEGQFNSASALYAEDFGEEAANQLKGYVRHEARKDERQR